MPHLKSLVERHADDPFTLLGINYNDKEADYRKGVKDFGMTWPAIYQGYEGNMPASPISKLFEVSGYPTYILIGPDGKILGSGHDGSAYDKKIAALIKEIKAKDSQ